MQNRTAYALTLLLLVQAMAATLSVVPMDANQEEWQGPVFESGARSNNSSSNCGSTVNYTSVSAYAPYMVMENQSFTTSMYVNCEILNASMLLNHWIYDSSNSTVYSGNQSWNGTTNTSSNFTSSVSGLAAGNYTFHADLYVDETLVDSDSDSFMVYANNSGGGGSGNNTSSSDAHCLTIDNISMSSTYVLSFDLVNICSIQMNYPGVNASVDHAGVFGLPSTSSWWYYAIWPNGSYNFSIQLSFDENVSNNTVVNLTINPTILNCGGNNSWHECPDSTSNYTFTYVILSNNSGVNTTADADGDGVADAYDNCITVFNPNQSDADMDGIGTECDADESNGNSENNTGGDNTDGNDTGGNNTGDNTENNTDDNTGNNTGDNTEGNNTNDNNTGSNNNAENNTDGNTSTDGNNTLLDTDGDGIDDATDNCQFVANPDQADTDGNGVGTACDVDEILSSEDTGALPSIGMLATGLCLLGAALLVRRD